MIQEIHNVPLPKCNVIKALANSDWADRIMHPQPTSEENPSAGCPRIKLPAYWRAVAAELKGSPLTEGDRGMGGKSVRYVIHIRVSKSSRKSGGHVVAASAILFSGIIGLSVSTCCCCRYCWCCGGGDGGAYCFPRHQIICDGSSLRGSGSQK